mmetsp:Transcript_21694/g.60182  ORF Transcript_21694/g.60182 Transcript_21694/m.60182 type:complete len:152 (+) Transcript_21694:1920-2375(+)|eukprot:CAMPEP_0202344444 /NCGR_PEP_ID=MMETSP1126-20121109/4125_1 /ASSEMBLY_ACC=CAM_ASM_000457 /TAXON_ID=3047 /ORGANISM="Dunaliella tertiolecta, Strain CCMP1320" /LENGTH=151 /DNA_ID=CAMNT_0048935639 /DNA_START=21 /DNA_END=476 /DNA_ORIENTATION=-
MQAAVPKALSHSLFAPVQVATRNLRTRRRHLCASRAEPAWANFLFENTNPALPDRTLDDILQQKLSEASSNYAIVHEQQQPMQQEPLEQESLEQESRKEPCKACKGNKKLACHLCCGAGRTNHIGEILLPRGVFPDWCPVCRGSGLEKCGR